jgi:hypothetical protein
MKRLLVTAAIIAIPGIAMAGELKMKAFYQLTSATANDVGDVPGHSVGVTKASGTATMPDGELASTRFFGQVDFTNGSGPAITYTETTFSDGSTLWMKTVADVVNKGNKADIKGSIMVLGGKGKYAGAKGTGEFTGIRLNQDENYPTRIINDITLKVTCTTATC